MQKTMFFDRFGTTNIAAVVEAGKLVEFHADGQTDRDTAGNIYKGRVVNVLAGMQAALSRIVAMSFCEPRSCTKGLSS